MFNYTEACTFLFIKNKLLSFSLPMFSTLVFFSPLISTVHRFNIVFSKDVEFLYYLFYDYRILTVGGSKVAL